MLVITHREFKSVPDDEQALRTIEVRNDVDRHWHRLSLCAQITSTTTS